MLTRDVFGTGSSRMPKSMGMVVSSVSCLAPMVAPSGKSAKTFIYTCHYAQMVKWMPRLQKDSRESCVITPWMHVCKSSLPTWMQNRYTNVSLKYYFDECLCLLDKCGSIPPFCSFISYKQWIYNLSKALDFGVKLYKYFIFSWPFCLQKAI